MARLAGDLAKNTKKVLLRVYGAQLLAPSACTSLTSLRRTITSTGCVRAGRWYTDKHEWLEVDGKVGTVGISDYAQKALGDVVYAQLPDVGSLVAKGAECGALESVKAASELISPVGGKVISKNEDVEKKPALINTSCYKDGWLFKVELNDPQEIKSLMNEEAYTEFLKTDPH
ncbi:uncharacterized protein LOC105702285 [Orussus abietinus]|uniref:uncharacterized protein LOC105702285 n=1 Tax=Orussus abietinus TaxID=222816 RepID=UPI000626A0ED|nr:uncharacterized protein LOC105702285 [Orussus abietinus]XP_012285175.1 uncharacterized protein LOC105702285 [Orussus abietinus]